VPGPHPTTRAPAPQDPVVAGRAVDQQRSVAIKQFRLVSHAAKLTGGTRLPNVPGDGFCRSFRQRRPETSASIRLPPTIGA
jgi:hypothetical protein